MATQQTIRVLNTPSDVAKCAMGMSVDKATLQATFTANVQLAADGANWFMAKYPEAKASCGTIQAIRSAVGRVPVPDTEAPYTILFLKESGLFVIGRRTKQANPKADSRNPEEVREADIRALRDMIDKYPDTFDAMFIDAVCLER